MGTEQAGEAVEVNRLIEITENTKKVQGNIKNVAIRLLLMMTMMRKKGSLVEVRKIEAEVVSVAGNIKENISDDLFVNKRMCSDWLYFFVPSITLVLNTFCK